MQAVVDAAVKKRLARETRKQQRAEDETQTTSDTSDNGVSPQLAAMSEAVRKLQSQLTASEFSREAAERGIKDKRTLDFLRDSYLKTSEDDRGKWWENLPPFQPVTLVPENKPPATTTPSANVTSDNGAPNIPGNSDGVIDITRLSRDEVNRLQRSGKLLEVVERYRDSLPGGGGTVWGRPPVRKQR